MGIELQILNYLQTLHNPVLDSIMIIVTKFGDHGLFWILLALVMIAIPKTRKVGITMAIALVIFHISCNMILKPLVARPRPYTQNPSIVLLVKQLKDYSFPSGHSAASFAMVAVFYLYKMKKSWIASLILSIGIAFSRLYLYVHYPTDVLIGMFLGIFFGWIAYKIMNDWNKKKVTENIVTGE